MVDVTRPTIGEQSRRWVSDLVEEGVDLASVQALLGHASLTSTSIYVSAAPEHLREAITGRRPYSRHLRAADG